MSLETYTTVVIDVKKEIAAVNQALSNVRHELTILGDVARITRTGSGAPTCFFMANQTKRERPGPSKKKLALNICSAQLSLSLQFGSTECAHGISRFSPDKKCPVTVKFCSAKQKVLTPGKAYNFNVCREQRLPTAVQEARRELLRFARLRNKPFKLKLIGLFIGTQIFVYGPESECCGR